MRDQRIEVSTYMPLFVRGLLFLAGSAACLMVVIELGGALWPPTLLTLFFGVIVLGGISVGGSFMAGALLAPNVRWAVAPGEVTIEAELFGRIEAHTFARQAFSRVIVDRRSHDTSPDGFGLTCTLADPVTASAVFLKHRRALDLLAFLVSPGRAARARAHLLRTLHSPDFRSREEAERALALLGE